VSLSLVLHGISTKVGIEGGVSSSTLGLNYISSVFLS